MSVADNLARIQETVGNHPVKLIAVSKSVGPEKVAEAYHYGVTEFGENRVQDALRKREQINADVAKKINWHFVGHLQTNKVKQVVGKFSLIHSVDSMRLAEEVSKTAQQQGIVQPVLLQVKMAEDPSKGGFTPDELRRLFPQLLQLPGIDIRGLMTITPLAADAALTHQCFCGLRDLRDELRTTFGVTLGELSMGMSDDYPEAIRCGATMVRIGRAIFNE